MSWWLAMLVSASMADATTTHIALNQGLHELNPLQRNTAVMWTSHAVVPVVFEMGMRKLERRHPKWATVGRWSFVGVFFGAAIWNSTRE